MKKLRTSLLPALLSLFALCHFASSSAADTTVYYVLPLQNMDVASNNEDAQFIPTTFHPWYQCAGAPVSKQAFGDFTSANVYTFTTSDAIASESASGGWLSSGVDLSPILTGDYDLLFNVKTTSLATMAVKLVVDGNEAQGNEVQFTADNNDEWQTVRLNVKEKFPNFAGSDIATANAYVFSFVAGDGLKAGDTFDIANVRYVPKGTTDEFVTPEPVDPVIPGLVKSVNSIDANISYTAAILDEEGQIVWNIPQTIKDQLKEDDETHGISGRYIKIKPWNKNGEPTIWAPEIPYTIGNDAYGHLYVTLDIPEDNLPDGFVPQLIINNNQENRDQNFHKNEDGKWEAKSKYPYPNNSTISYYFRANFKEGGQIQTRTFGYKVEKVTNETSEPHTLTTLAEAALGQGQVSGQIYTCHAHDPSYPVKEEERGEGKWFRTARPVDYANTTDEHGEFYFCPPFEYIIANDATAAASGDSKIFVAVKFPEYDGNTVIPTDFQPQVLIYDIDKYASTRAYNGIPEGAEVMTLPMKHVAGMVNTYQTDINNTKEFPANKKLGVAFHYAYWSIVLGNGYSSTGPRTYVMSVDNTVVTGIEETGADAEPALSTVYNLQGIAVRINVATKEALAGLPAGIYIINGKKYAVK